MCYNCDEYYKPGHICKSQQLFMLVATNEDDTTIPMEETAPEEVSDSTPNLEISLHALTSYVVQDTIRVPGSINNHNILVLVDTRSTHSFLDAKITEQLNLHIEPTGPMLVTVSNGDTNTSKGFYPQLMWSMQGHQFCWDLRVLPLGGCDMVLGVDWLKQLGDVVFNLTQRKIAFMHQAIQITLLGNSSSNSSISMISGNTFRNFIK